jgi:hypothetical protein
MQRERYDIGCRKGLLRQFREKQFVDEPIAFDANAVFCRAFGVSCHYETAVRPVRTHYHVRAVIERTDQVTFRARDLVIGRQVQACLHDRQVKEPIVFATHHKRKAQEIDQDGSGPIEAIKAQQGAFFWELASSQIGLDHVYRSAQFLSVFSVAWMTKGTEPLLRMRAAQIVVRVRTISPRFRPV